MLFFDTVDSTNPFRNLTMIDIVEPAPVALSKTEWNAVRRCAEHAARRDHGLAFALATLFRYAGPRVSEVAALQIPDIQISARRGLLIIRRGKGLKHREVPLMQEAREPLEAYLTYREHDASWCDNSSLESVAAWPSVSRPTWTSYGTRHARDHCQTRPSSETVFAPQPARSSPYVCQITPRSRCLWT
jgi:integrase